MTTEANDELPAMLAGLHADFPGFRFRYERIGHRGLRWVAERKDGLSPGVHTVITEDPRDLRIALIQDSGQSNHRRLTGEQALRALL